MNIINISQNFEIKGGSDVYFHLLTELLNKKGYTVEEFASTNEWKSIFPRSIDFEKRNLSTVFKYLYNKEAKQKLSNFISSKHFDLAHLHIYYGKLTSSILEPLVKQKIPIVQTLHEYKLVCPTYKLHDGNDICFACQDNKFHKSIAKKCNRDSLTRTAISALEAYISLWAGSQKHVDHFITVSNFQKSQIVKMGISPEKITTVHNFIDTKNIAPSEDNEDYILYFGRIEKVKGLEVLLEAMRLVSDKIKLIIVGDGEFKEEMLKIISNSKQLTKKVIYYGFLKGAKLDYIVSKSKFVVVPSTWYETFGLTVLEAMARGKPVIGSDIGGISEIIKHDYDGFLTPPNDIVRLAGHITHLYFDNKLAIEMGKRARNKAVTVFSPEVHFENLRMVYSKLTCKQD